jgi:hypothetical protein
MVPETYREKMRLTFHLMALPRPIARDNEGADEGGSPDQGSVDQTPDEGGEGSGGNRTFTQADVDKIVVTRVKKLKEQLQKTEQQYERLLTNQNLSVQERNELQQELETVQAQLRTREEQARYEAKKQSEKFQQTLEQTTGERDRFKTLFETQTRDNAIMQAAVQHDAYNPEQFISVLGPRTKIVEEVNEQGEKTGRLVPRVEVQVTGEDGTTSTELRPVEDAVAQMKDEPEKYGNLFRNNVAGGIGEGSNPSGGGRPLDPSKVSTEEYFKNRDAYKQQYGIRDRRGF